MIPIPTHAYTAGKAPARKIPLEILVAGDKEPSYGETLEEQGLYQARPVLPFSAYGTMAMLHPPDDPNGGSTGAFWCAGWGGRLILLCWS